jgi:hypothetical protein
MKLKYAGANHALKWLLASILLLVFLGNCNSSFIDDGIQNMSDEGNGGLLSAPFVWDTDIIYVDPIDGQSFYPSDSATLNGGMAQISGSLNNLNKRLWFRPMATVSTYLTITPDVTVGGPDGGPSVYIKPPPAMITALVESANPSNIRIYIPLSPASSIPNEPETYTISLNQNI